jgi:hypothetical protein
LLDAALLDLAALLPYLRQILSVAFAAKCLGSLRRRRRAQHRIIADVALGSDRALNVVKLHLLDVGHSMISIILLLMNSSSAG